jgi:hypothetical protein
MKFCKVTTIHTQREIDNIIMSMKSPEIDYIMDLYKKMSIVEYTDDNGYECMFAIIDEFLIDKIDEVYKKYSIEFELKDLTMDVIFDNPINTKYKNFRGKSCHRTINNLIKEFKVNWVTKDDILDKILEKGMNSLTKLDLEILKS